MHTLEKSLVDELPNEVDSVLTTFETLVQDAKLTAIENMVNPSLESAMKSLNGSPERSVDSVIQDPDQKKNSGFIEGLQMTASSRLYSNTYIKKVGETRGSFTEERVDWSVNKTNFDRQTHTHHSQLVGVKDIYFDNIDCRKP